MALTQACLFSLIKVLSLFFYLFGYIFSESIRWAYIIHVSACINLPIFSFSGTYGLQQFIRFGFTCKCARNFHSCLCYSFREKKLCAKKWKARLKIHVPYQNPPPPSPLLSFAIPPGLCVWGAGCLSVCLSVLCYKSIQADEMEKKIILFRKEDFSRVRKMCRSFLAICMIRFFRVLLFLVSFSCSTLSTFVFRVCLAGFCYLLSHPCLSTLFSSADTRKKNIICSLWKYI